MLICIIYSHMVLFDRGIGLRCEGGLPTMSNAANQPPTYSPSLAQKRFDNSALWVYNSHVPKMK